MPREIVEPIGVFGSWVATDLLEVSDDPRVLDGEGRWAVLVTYEGRVVLARFGRWVQRELWSSDVGQWWGPYSHSWSSSLDEAGFVARVEHIRGEIGRGNVYQANLCRILSAPMAGPADVVALHRALRAANPAPLQGALRLPETGVRIASASPELFLRRAGDLLVSRPIKGTAAVPGSMLGKDSAENVMIVDLVRNDLAQVCRPGSVDVPGLLEEEQHPGLVHLVSTVTGRLREGVGWPGVLRATFPPGSVTGAPKIAAVDMLSRVEPVSRGPYCGAFGWVDADRGEAELAVAIRTFWVEEEGDAEHAVVRFGTGAGITWGSDPALEWQETELKARRLLRIASRRHGTPTADAFGSGEPGATGGLVS